MKRWITLLCLFLSIVLIGVGLYIFSTEDRIPEPIFPEKRFSKEKYDIFNIHNLFKNFNDSSSVIIYDRDFKKQPLKNNERYFYNFNFRNASSKKDTTFIGSIDIFNEKSYGLKSKLKFSYHTIEIDTSFVTKHYEGDLSFVFSSFKSFNFNFIKLDGKFHLYYSNIDSTANFFHTSFSSYASFDWTHFNDDVNYRACTFNSKVSFINTIFSKKLILSNLELNSSAKFTFDQSRLPDTLDFSSNSRIYNDIDLTVAEFHDNYRFSTNKPKRYKPHYINLYKSDISKFHLDYTHFKLLKNYYAFNYNKFKDIPYDEMCGIYEGLLNNFENRGQKESYELLDIEYKDYKWQHSKTPWMSEVERLWWNYGYDKQLIFKWVIVFLLSFTLITFLFLSYFNSTYELQRLTNLDRFSFRNLTIKTLFIKWWCAFVYSAAIFFGLTLKIENIEYKKFWGTLYIVFMYTLGIVCLAYMANFVIQN